MRRCVDCRICRQSFVLAAASASHSGTGPGRRRRDLEVVILQVRGRGEHGDDDAKRDATDNGQQGSEKDAFHGGNCERDGLCIMMIRIDFWKYFSTLDAGVLE